MSIVVKPCPFCGGKAKISEGWELEEYVATVWCKTCQAEVVCIADDEENALNGAVEKWNRRKNER